MRFVVIASIVVLIHTAVAAESTGAASAGPTVVSERNGEIVLSISPRAEDPALLPFQTILVAVPAGVAVTAERIGGSFEARPMLPRERQRYESSDPQMGEAPLPPGLYPGSPGSPVVVSSPFLFRNAHVVAVACYFRQLDSESKQALDWTAYRVAVRYPAASRTRDRSRVDPVLAAHVANRDIFSVSAGRDEALRFRTAGQAGIDPHFSLSPRQNWIKFGIERRGMYEVTYGDLLQYGVGNPSTFRLFTGTGFGQPRDLDDPGGSWRIGNWMTETPIYVDDGDDGTFDAGDRIVFYGLGAGDWLNYYDSTAPDTVYHVHPRAKLNYYYLTWEGDFPGQPLRMSEVPSAPGAGPDRTTYRHRVYVEKDRTDDYDYGGDFWLWEKWNARILDEPLTARLETVDVADLVAGPPQQFRTIALAPYDTDRYEIVNADTIFVNRHHATYIAHWANADHPIGDFVWESTWNDKRYEDGRPVFLSGTFLTEGSNEIRLRIPKDVNRKDWMYFAWFSIAYERRLRARGDRLAFSSPDTTGTVSFLVTGLPPSGQVHVFDVTDRFGVKRLTNAEVTGGGLRSVRFSSTVSGPAKHFWVTTVGALARPPSWRKIQPVDLRAETVGAHMLIVSDPASWTAAERLASHRRSHMPHFGSGNVKIATPEQIYDNFSGGQPDPMAIRNYIKFMYDNFTDNGDPLLSFVLLLGDANIDFKNRVSADVDQVPTFVYLPPVTVDGYAFTTDEWYAHMDASDQELGNGVWDVAIGRLPSATSKEANILVDKVIRYETQAPLEPWRNEVVLVADDPGPDCQKTFTTDSEDLENIYLPQYVDVHKVYLTEYPGISGLKPGSRLALLELWKSGVLAINYIGHGGTKQLADEQVFLDRDAVNLDNGLRLPVLTAFSCTVGDYANSAEKSLSEKLLVHEGGGVIGTVTASSLSYISPNTTLNYETYRELLPSVPGPAAPLGESVLTAKLNVMVSIGLGYRARGRENNNWKYNLLCDPALHFAGPQNEVRILPGDPDTLVAGVRKSIRGGVFRGGALDTSFNGTVAVRVHEPDVRRHISEGSCVNLNYDVRGGGLYRGTADVTNGEFEISFRVPRFAEPGPSMYFTAYAENGLNDAGNSIDDVFDLIEPTIADSMLLVPVDGPPRVDLGFKSGLDVVKPGESLRAVVRDQDGINIMSTTSEGRHVLLIDNSPVALDVTKFFEFDHGGTDTSGVLTYPLPDLAVGDHRAILRVADSFAQTTLDTLWFSVTDPLDYFAEVVLNYPNPFVSTTQFLFRLSDRASVRLDIFTVSGKRIRRLEEVRDGGEQWVFWDGRDTAGDEIANGTYLYVATVEFQGIERAPLILRGKLTKIQ